MIAEVRTEPRPAVALAQFHRSLTFGGLLQLTNRPRRLALPAQLPGNNDGRIRRRAARKRVFLSF